MKISWFVHRLESYDFQYTREQAFVLRNHGEGDFEEEI